MAGVSWDRLLGIALAASMLTAAPAGAAGFSPPPGAAAAAPRPTSPAPPPAAAPAPPAPASVPAAVDPESPGHPPPPAAAVRVTTARLDPDGKPRAPLYRRWAFWGVAGALVLGAVAITYAASRPAPAPYYGNLSPQVIVLP